jgi:hypothetical protein
MFGLSLRWKEFVDKDHLIQKWNDLKMTLDAYVDNLSYSTGYSMCNGDYMRFKFTEKQETPGFRKMKISKKSRFHKETP